MIDDVRLDQLTREMGWIRGLARALVSRDTEDLAQDAWLVAAEQAPADRPLRPWLARMTSNLARMRGRSASRRERRELAVEVGPTPTPEELVERVQLGRVVAAEVIALDEPYRSTILLHFFEGLSSAEIGRRLGVPDGTVRRRLKVGLDQLRERLRDRRDPPQGGWLAALIPVAGPMRRVKAVAKPAVAATTTSTTAIVVAAIVMAIVAGAIWKLASRGGDDAPVSTAPPIAHVYPAIAPPAPGVMPTVDPMRLAQPGAPSRRVAGTVRFAGVPVAGAIVHLGAVISGSAYSEPMFQRLARVTTDADGRFDFGLRPAARYLVTAQAATRAPISQTIEVADPKAGVDMLELALGACTTTLAGRVRDAQGTGLVAHVETLELAAIDTSDTGDYKLCVDVALVTHWNEPRDPVVRVSADGYGTMQRGLQGRGELRLDFVLVPAATAGGRVVDEQDHPVACARVVAWPAPFGTIDYAAARFAVTGDDGRFQIDQLAPGRWWIKAMATDAGQSSPALATIAPETPTTPVRLVVTPRARVRGRVLRDGAPVAAAEVRIGEELHAFTQADGTFVIEGVEPGMLWFRIGDEVVSPDDILVDRAVLDVELSLHRHNQIVGHVTQGGAPVAASVSCNYLGNVTADASGAYAIRSPLMRRADPPQPWHVYASMSCDATEPTAPRVGAEQVVVLSSNQSATVNFELPPCGPVVHPAKPAPPTPDIPGFHGVVFDKAGAPVVGALVRFAASETTTDVHGTFKLDVMTAGVAPLVFFPSRSAEAPLPLLSRTGDGTSAPAQLVVDADLVAIHGRVVDTAGAPVADARVQVRGVIGLRAATSADDAYVAVTGTDGAFTIDHLAQSSGYTITAMAGTLRGEVHGAIGEVKVVVGGNGSIHGELLGDWDGTPAMTARPMGSRTRELAVTVGDDEFDIVDLPPGPYEISAYDGTADRTVVAWVQSGKAAHTSLFGRDHKRRNAAHLVELGAARPIIGMACQAGESSPIIASDEQGLVETMYENHLTCWSSRGPYVAVTPSLSCGPACGSNDDDVQVIALVRPGMAHPGFVVAPLSRHPIVAVVDDDGAAKQAGLEASDAIVELDGAGVAQLSAQELMYLVWTHAADTMTLGVVRDGSRRDIAIHLR